MSTRCGGGGGGGGGVVLSVRCNFKLFIGNWQIDGGGGGGGGVFVRE